MTIDIPLDLYKVFYTVVKTGNMSQAAKKLYISQPAVSMAIRQLEGKLGGTLLIRTPKGVRPTSEGQVLYTYLDQALNLIATAEKKYIEMLNLESGEINIGASDSILNNFMMPYLEKYNNEHKNITIKITNRTSGGALTILKRGDIDLAFVNLPLEESGPFEVHECAEIHDILVGGSQYVDLVKKGVSFKDLNNYPLLLAEKDSNTRRYIDDFALGLGVQLHPIFELGATDLLLKFTKINWGLTFVTKEFVGDLLDSGDIFEVPLDPPLPPRHIGVAHLKNVELSNSAKSFAQMFYNDEKREK